MKLGFVTGRVIGENLDAKSCTWQRVDYRGGGLCPSESSTSGIWTYCTPGLKFSRVGHRFLPGKMSIDFSEIFCSLYDVGCDCWNRFDRANFQRRQQEYFQEMKRPTNRQKNLNSQNHDKSKDSEYAS